MLFMLNIIYLKLIQINKNLFLTLNELTIKLRSLFLFHLKLTFNWFCI